MKNLLSNNKNKNPPSTILDHLKSRSLGSPWIGAPDWLSQDYENCQDRQALAVRIFKILWVLIQFKRSQDSIVCWITTRLLREDFVVKIVVRHPLTRNNTKLSGLIQSVENQKNSDQFGPSAVRGLLIIEIICLKFWTMAVKHLTATEFSSISLLSTQAVE